MITQARLRELFDYREDGVFIRKIPVSNNKGKVGDVIVGTYYTKKDGYSYIRQKVDNYFCMFSRLIWLWHHGWMPAQIDHKDRDPLNNRIENLRAATASQNAANKIVMECRNTSGFKGVHKHGNKWRARIDCKGKISLGYFDDPIEAAKAYNRAALELFGEFACLNIISKVPPTDTE